MSLSPDLKEDSSLLPLSELRMNLDNQFLSVQDLSKAEGMCVFARVRPMLNSETEAGYKECIAAIDDETVRAFVPTTSAKYKSNRDGTQDVIQDFKFSAAYGPETGQFVFFQECMMNTIQNFIEGQNSLVFSYGITGSGKTFTLQGNIENPGIIPLSLHLFFASVENQLLDSVVVKPDKFTDVILLNESERKKEIQIKEQLLSASDQEEWNLGDSSTTKSFAVSLCQTFSDNVEIEERHTTLCPEDMAQAQAAAIMKEMSKKAVEDQEGYCSLWVSFAEVYNETVYDLLQPVTNSVQRVKLNLGEDKNGDVYIKGLREVCVFSSYETLQLLSLGQKNLRYASTKLNYHSSRSHCIFTIKVIRIPHPENIAYARVNRLSFCDLAGSERSAKAQTTGVRLKEAGCINTSLHVLGKCLEQLRLNPSLRDKKLIPFRESKLTRLFSGFFIGRGRAVMIANASPSEFTFDETLHVLRFSAISKEIIINDSYIATASKTLQNISNMWTNAKSNNSVSTDKSISFDDSMEEILQEKDEIIEKLLDLAESMKNNLEKEKKEKADLELNIRQEVYREYSEFSDDLLDRQKKTYEKECEAIKEIYQKRLSAMESMYTKIIEDYKNQLDESDSSDGEGEADKSDDMDIKEEDSDDKAAGEDTTRVSDNQKCEIHIDCSFIKESARLALEVEALKGDLLFLNDKLRNANEELNKISANASSLEHASLEMEKNIEISNLNLEKALNENERLQSEIDSLHTTYQEKIMNYEFENQKFQEVLEKESGITKREKELLEEKNDDLKDEINRLNSIISENEEKHEISLSKHQNETKEVREVLITSNNALENATLEIENQRIKLESLQKECNFYKREIGDLEITKKNLEERCVSLTEDLELQKAEFKSQETELIKCTKTVEELNKKLEALHFECISYKNKILELEKVKSNMEVELSSHSSERQSVENAIETVRSECTLYKTKVSELENMKTHLEEALESAQSEFTLHKDKVCELEKNKSCLEKELSCLNERHTEEKNVLQHECTSYKNKISELEKNKCCLESKLSCLSERHTAVKEALQSECTLYKNKISELEKIKSNLEEELLSFSYDKQADENDKKTLQSECTSYKNKVSELEKIKTNLEEELSYSSNERQVVEKYKEELKSLQSEFTSYKDKVSELEKNKSSLEKELSCLTERHTEEKETLQSECTLYKNKLSEWEKIKNNLEEELSSLNVSETIRKYKEELESLKSECTSYKEKVFELQNPKNNSDKILTSNYSYIPEKHSKDTLVSEQEATIHVLEHKLSLTPSNSKMFENSSGCSFYENNVAELEKDNNVLEEKLCVSTESESFIAEKCILEEQIHEYEKLLFTLKEKLALSEKNCSEVSIQKAEKEELIKNLDKELCEIKGELQVVNENLKSALETLDKQKEEIDSFKEAEFRSKIVIQELEDCKHSLECQLMNLSNDLASAKALHGNEVNSLSSKLGEALHSVTEQQEKFDSLQADCNSLKNELLQLKEVNDELQKKLHSYSTPSCNLMLELIDILQNCELQASKKLQCNSEENCDRIKTLFEKLESFEKSNEVQQKEQTILIKMIEVLQKCEFSASNKAKELHSSSIKHVEQIMDLKEYAEKKENIISKLKDEYSTLQKEFKALQLSSKKQIQSEKEKLVSEMKNLKELHKIELKKRESEIRSSTEVERKNLISEMENLKECHKAELEKREAEIRSSTEVERKNLISAMENLKELHKAELEKREAEIRSLMISNPENGSESKEITPKMRSKSSIEPNNKKEISSETISSINQKKRDEKRSVLSVKSEENVHTTSKNIKAKSESEQRKLKANKPPLVKSNEEALKKGAGNLDIKEDVEEQKKVSKPNEPLLQNRGRRALRNPNSGNVQEKAPKLDGKQKSKEISDNIQAKKPNSDSKEKNKENLKNVEEMSKTTGKRVNVVGRRQLRNMENITDFNLKASDENSKTLKKSLKRKSEDEFGEEIFSETALKKIKMHSIDVIENQSKTQNLRMQVLLGVPVDKIGRVAPSPRMTRSRRRLESRKDKKIDKSKNFRTSLASPNKMR